MKELSSLGYLPEDWVSITLKNLDEKKAYQLEKESLDENGVTKFNRQSGQHQYKTILSDEQAIEIFDRTRKGENHRVLAEEFDVSRSTISMIASKKQWKRVLKGL